MSGGEGLVTIDFFRADKEMPVKKTIQNALSPSGLLFSTDVYEEASRAMIIIKGDRKYLSIDEISTEVEKLSGAVGHVFKGIVVSDGEYTQVLSLLTLESVHELEKLYNVAVQAIHYEKAKKQRVEERNELKKKPFSRLKGWSLNTEYSGPLFLTFTFSDFLLIFYIELFCSIFPQFLFLYYEPIPKLLFIPKFIKILEIFS